MHVVALKIIFSTFAKLHFKVNLVIYPLSCLAKNLTLSNLTCMRQSVLLWVANLFTDKLLENLSPSRLWRSQKAAGQSATGQFGP